MAESRQKDWIEDIQKSEHTGSVEKPLDAWIELALYSDYQSVTKLLSIVEHAVKRRKWELENVPTRWVNVRETKINQLGFWVAIQDKLRSLLVAVEDVPF